jgi:hypothetical protein
MPEAESWAAGGRRQPRPPANSQTMRGAVPSRAGPRYILPFWIVNGAVICGLPSGPGLAKAVSAIWTSAACSGVI